MSRMATPEGQNVSVGAQTIQTAGGDFVGHDRTVYDVPIKNWFHLLPPSLYKQLEKLVTQSGMNQESLVAKALALMGLALKAEQQGLKLAVVDEDGAVVADVAGVEGNVPALSVTAEENIDVNEAAFATREQPEPPMYKQARE